MLTSVLLSSLQSVGSSQKGYAPSAPLCPLRCATAVGWVDRAKLELPMEFVICVGSLVRRNATPGGWAKEGKLKNLLSRYLKCRAGTVA